MKYENKQMQASFQIAKMQFLFCLCVLSSIAIVSASIPKYILQSGDSGHCGQTVNVEKSVYVKSHSAAGLLGGLVKHTANQNCEITYNAGTGKQLLFKFTFFDLQPPVSSVCVDYVRLTGVTAVSPNATTTTLATTTLAVTSTTATPSTAATNETVENATISNTTEAENATSTTDNSTTSSTVPTSNYTEPSGVNATYWSFREVCNYTLVNQTVEGTNQTINGTTIQLNETTIEVNETLCWNVTESYVVWIPFTAGQVDLCQSEGLQAYVSMGSTGTIQFVSDGSTQRGGFSLLITSFHTENCTDSEFLCDVDRCISDTLLCDGDNNCVDRTDESTEQAGCSAIQAFLSAKGLNKYAVIGIAVVGGAVLLTVVTVAIFWKGFGKGEGRVGISEDSPLTTQSTSGKPKKTVTIVTEKKPTAPPKGPRKIQVKPVTSKDVEW